MYLWISNAGAFEHALDEYEAMHSAHVRRTVSLGTAQMAISDAPPIQFGFVFLCIVQ